MLYVDAAVLGVPVGLMCQTQLLDILWHGSRLQHLFHCSALVKERSDREHSPCMTIEPAALAIMTAFALSVHFPSTHC